MNDRQKRYFFIIVILGALATISAFSIDMYLPGFPAIARDLGTTIDKVQLSLTAYLIGIAVGQLFYGPLLDRFGRKYPLYIGLIIYIIASIGCAYTESVNFLIGWRFLQAIGGCAGMVASQALVRDIFPVNKMAQAFSLITLVIAVSPMIAPAVGGYVTPLLGWHSVFIILAVITAVVLICSYFYLPSGKGPDATLSLKPAAVLSNFGTVIRNQQFFIYTLAGGIAMAAPFGYIAGSADVFINIYKVSEQAYGWIFALLASSMIGSTQLNHILLKKFKSEQIIRFALTYQTIVGAVLVVGTYLGWYDLISFIVLIFIFLSGQGLIGPNTVALSLAPFTKNAGSAAALFGSWRLGAGGIISAIVSFLHNHTAMPMVTIMFGCALVGLTLLLTGNTVVRHRARKQTLEEEAVVV